MNANSEHNFTDPSARDYRRALDSLPNHCALDLAELSRRIGADKLELIAWARADIEFARLIASKVANLAAGAAGTRAHWPLPETTR